MLYFLYCIYPALHSPLYIFYCIYILLHDNPPMQCILREWFYSDISLDSYIFHHITSIINRNLWVRFPVLLTIWLDYVDSIWGVFLWYPVLPTSKIFLMSDDSLVTPILHYLSVSLFLYHISPLYYVIHIIEFLMSSTRILSQLYWIHPIFLSSLWV